MNPDLGKYVVKTSCPVKQLKKLMETEKMDADVRLGCQLIILVLQQQEETIQHLGRTKK